MKAKLLSTSLVSVGLGACGLGLWKMKSGLEQDSLQEQQRLLHPSHSADCVNTIEIVAPLGKKISVVDNHEDCMRRLETQSISKRN